MRLTIFFILLSLGQLIASSGYSQTARLNLALDNATIEQVLNKIEDESEFYFLYNKKLIDVEREININVEDKKIKDILDLLFDNTEVMYSVVDRQIVLSDKTIMQQANVLTGKVTDINGAPLPGVTVVVKGTTHGAVTNSDGTYSIQNVSKDATLMFSFVGMKTLEIPVEGKDIINAVMTLETIGLNEVVAIGYGTMKKSDLTGSVVSVETDELLKRHPVSLEQGLQGLAAGVQIIRNSGTPGAGATVRIRGAATINNSAEPLYVVDGIMVGSNANFLNPKDIESIEILKDASATAIYGARGANGVIMITTKTGGKGRANITFDASFGLQSQNSTIDVANAEQFVNAANEVALNDEAAYNPVWTNPSTLNSIDWQNEMIRSSLVQQYNFSASGGSENTQAMMSVGYVNNDGIILETNYNRITARGNITHKVKDFIRTGMNIAYMHSESKGSGNLMDYAELIPTMDTLSTSNGTLINVPVQYPDGTWGHFPRENNYNSPSADNPVAVAKERDDLSFTNRVLANAFFEIDLLEGLTFKSVGGINYIGSGYKNYRPRNYRTYNSNPTDYLTLNQNSSLEYLLENYLTYNGTFGKHRVTGLLGYSVSKGSSQFVGAKSSDFAVNTIRNIELSQSPESIYGSGGLGIDTREQSFFGRIIYSFADRYLLTSTLRRDGSSNFGAGNKYGTFPSLSLGWRVSEESFMNSQTIFSNLKVRAGWGQTGNAGNQTNLSVDQISSDRIAYYLFNPSNNIFVASPGLAQISEIDTNLKWETNEQLNFGLDMSFLDNSLTIVTDYFRRDAKDLLLFRGLRPSTGYTQIYTNAGHIRNTGFEFQVGYQKKWGNWDFNVNANATTVKNEAIDIGDDIYSSEGAGTGAWWTGYSVTRNGFPVGSYFGWRTDGIFQTQEEIDALNDAATAAGSSNNAYQSVGTKPGDWKYKDLDENGWVDDQDREILGNGYPDLTYGLNLNLGYKNFDFSLYLYGVIGQDILSYSYRKLTSFNTNNILTDYALNAWDREGSTNKYPRLTKADVNHNGQISDAFIFDGDFLKVQNIQLGYTLPKHIINGIHLESVRVFGSVENLLTLTKYEFGDPEVGNSNVQQVGFDGGRYPFPQIFTFGINLEF